ncbi:MAG: tetratricopeptide repeat protein [Acidobacteria bacterium]|nr:tetratricopeptide repeat protein [Acidobacteriota bacterium]
MLKLLGLNRHTSRFICIFFSLLICLSITSLTLAGQDAKESSRKRRVGVEEYFLLSGKDAYFAKQLDFGQKHIYQLSLKQGEYLSLGISKKDVDIVAMLFDPNDKKLVEVSSLSRPQDPEIGLYLLIDITGEYKLHIIARNDAAGGYALKIKELRPSNKQDKDRIASQSAYDEAEKLRLQNTKESLEKAFNIYTSLIPIWQELGDRESEGATLNAIGAIFFTATQYKESQQTLEEALKIWRDLNNPTWEVATLTSLGAVCNLAKENRQALQYYLKAQQIATKLNDPQWLAFTFSGLGKVSSDLGEMESSLSYYKEALAIRRSLKDKRGEAITLSNIANIYTVLENYQASLDYHLEALAIFNSIGDTSGEGSTLNNLGRSYMLLNNFAKSLESFELALKKKQQLQDVKGQATTFNNIGYLHMVSSEQKTAQHFLYSNQYGYGSKQKALEAFSQALELWRKLNDTYEEQTTLTLMAKVYSALGDQENFDKTSQQIMALSNINKANKDLPYITNTNIASNTNPLANANNPNNSHNIIKDSKNQSSENTKNHDNSLSNSVNLETNKAQPTIALPKPTTPEISGLNIPNKRINEKSVTKTIITKEDISSPKTDIAKLEDTKETVKENTLKEEIVKPNTSNKSENNKSENNKNEKGKYSIQLGALATKQEADEVSNRFRGAGLETYVMEGNAAGKIVFRVRMGKYQSIEEAKKVAAQLKAKGAIVEYFIATQ